MDGGGRSAINRRSVERTCRGNCAGVSCATCNLISDFVTTDWMGGKIFEPFDGSSFLLFLISVIQGCVEDVLSRVGD